MSLDTIPLVKSDLTVFQLKTYRKKIPDDIAAELLAEAWNTAVQVDEFVRLFRRVDRALQRHPDDAMLRSEWTGMVLDLSFLARALRYPRFGRFFPKTRRRLKQKVQHVLRYQSRRKPDMLATPDEMVESNLKLCGAPSIGDILSDNCSGSVSQLAQVAAKQVFSSTYLKNKVEQVRDFIREYGI